MPKAIKKITSSAYKLNVKLQGSTATAKMHTAESQGKELLIKIKLQDPYVPRATLEISELPTKQ
jgi:hypothetical protein